MKRSCSQSYFPPDPIVQVRFGSPEEMRFTQSIGGMVDTGADMTIASIELMRSIDVTIGGLQSIRSQWGEARSVRMLGVVDDERGQEIILGRNLLNRMRIILDGLTEEIEIVSY